jgi:hypothetical protein
MPFDEFKLQLVKHHGLVEGLAKRLGLARLGCFKNRTENRYVVR